MNLARGLEPFRHDALLTQSPLTIKNPESPWQNSTASALLHRETAVTAFQYPLALNLVDFQWADAQPPVAGSAGPGGGRYANRGEQRKDWLRYLLRAVSELNGVAGNHARSYFEMAPASIVIRLTDSLVAGYDLYAFGSDGTPKEILDGIAAGDYPGREFLIGGKVVRDMDDDTRAKLTGAGVRVYRMANQALDEVARRAAGRGFLEAPAA